MICLDKSDQIPRGGLSIHPDRETQRHDERRLSPRCFTHKESVVRSLCQSFIHHHAVAIVGSPCCCWNHVQRGTCTCGRNQLFGVWSKSIHPFSPCANASLARVDHLTTSTSGRNWHSYHLSTRTSTARKDKLHTHPSFCLNLSFCRNKKSLGFLTATLTTRWTNEISI